MLDLHPDVNATHVFPPAGGTWQLARTLRAARFTHVLDFDNTDKTALLTRLTGAPVRATFHRELIRFRWRWCYTHRAVVSNADYDRQHITATYLRLPAALGVPVADAPYRLTPPPAAVAFARDLLARHRPLSSRPRLLVHPGSRSEFRLWPAERFAAVLDRAARELGAATALVGGPGERPLLDAIARACTTAPAVFSAPLTIPQFAAFLGEFDVLLCHDSGPMHLAAGVGTRVIALYGSQNATPWPPLGDRHTVLQTPLPCPCLPDLPQPCVRTDSYRSYCVRQLDVPTVLQALRPTLQR